MFKRYLVVSVGCLECHHATYAAGPFRTLKQARQVAGSRGRLLSDMDYGPWAGESMMLIIDLATLPPEL